MSLQACEVVELVGDEEAAGVRGIDFTEVDEYTTFKAEYAAVGDNLVVHFFVTPEIRDSLNNHRYWLTVFPQVLSDEAQRYFRTDSSRLRAAYTEELASWWFQARGFADMLSFDEFVLRFLEKLDQALEATKSM